jgi:hypothetical protein
MTIFQSSTAKGQAATPSAYQAGIVTSAIFEYTFKSDYATATDVIELGLLPADTQIIGATVIAAGLGATTADIGIMTGTPGDTVAERTVGDELFDGTSVNDASADAPLASCLAVAPSNEHRAIGAKIAANVAADAAKKLTVKIDYVA